MTFQPVNSLLSGFFLLPSESNFPQSMHCVLLASVWPNKHLPLLNALSTEADVHECRKFSNNGFRRANTELYVGTRIQWGQTAFIVSHKMPWMCLANCRQELHQKSWKIARLFLQDRNQDQMFKTKTKTSWSKTKTKIFTFVLEEPRDQDMVILGRRRSDSTPALLT